METCADLTCNCGEHECIFKQQSNAIQPVVYPPIVRIFQPKEVDNKQGATQNADSRGRHFNETKAFDKPKSCIQHPSHMHSEYQHCRGHHSCGEITEDVESCGHGHYIPKSTPYEGQTCHPDRPRIIDVKQTVVEPDSKDCEKCKEVFSNLDSLWDTASPPRRKEDLLTECREVAECHCDHDVIIECCCRCCTCRGCPSCRTKYNHPCFYLSKARKNVYKPRDMRQDDVDFVCLKHPSGCYFAPNKNNEERYFEPNESSDK